MLGLPAADKHAVQALARLGGQRAKLFEADRRVDEVAQDRARRLGFAAQEQADSCHPYWSRACPLT